LTRPNAAIALWNYIPKDRRAPIAWRGWTSLKDDDFSVITTLCFDRSALRTGQAVFALVKSVALDPMEHTAHRTPTAAASSLSPSCVIVRHGR
jgi:hypothetical protein